MTVILHLEQRLLLDRVIGSQKGTVSDIMLWTALLKRIGFAGDRERQAAVEAYLLRAGQAGILGLLPAPAEPQEYELLEGEVDRIARALKGFNGYTASDYLLCESLLEAIGRAETAAVRQPGWFELPLQLTSRLSVLLFLKQQPGPSAEAGRLYRLAEKFCLDPREVEIIRYQSYRNGTARWDPSQAAAYTLQRSVLLTDAEIPDLLGRLQNHDQWSGADLIWLEPVLEKLAGKAFVVPIEATKVS